MMPITLTARLAPLTDLGEFLKSSKAQRSESASDLAFSLERMTGIEPALSAWESAPFDPIRHPTSGATLRE